MLPVFFLLVSLLPLSSALVDKNRLEKLRLYHGHDDIDTATVHIVYPHSPHIRRLTKREALHNLIPSRPKNFTVKVTLKSSGHVLDLQLQRSRLQVDGALVTAMKEGGDEEKYKVKDEGCHYQGFFDDSNGLASVHFCDGVLVGGAQNGHTEYYFHSRHHPVLNQPDEGEDEPAQPSDASSPTGPEEELHHTTIVSWTGGHGGSPLEDPWDYLVDSAGVLRVVEKGRKVVPRQRREADSGDDDDEDDSAPVQNDDPVMSGEVDDSDDPNYNSAKVPVAEFGVIFDEDFIRDRTYELPTRRDLIHFLMYKYTGVQALYGNPQVTGLDIVIQVKLIFLWYKNPWWYGGSNLSIGGRLGAGKNFSRENAVFRTVDIGALYTSQAPGYIQGLAFLNGACLNHGKTFITRGNNLNWITECHELGHTLGLFHSCSEEPNPWESSFMNSYKHRLLPCMKKRIMQSLQRKSTECLFERNVNTTNIPLVRLQPTWPILSLGFNSHCQTYFKSIAKFVFEENRPCGNVLCAVTDPASKQFGLAQITRDIEAPLNGRSCGPNGMICVDKECQLPANATTVTARDTVTGTGTWGGWSNYGGTCTSACGVGVRLSYRTCSNEDRAEACPGFRYRAQLCNTQPCPGDDLRSELELRWDRGNYSCSLVKARGSEYSQYFRPQAKRPSWRDLVSPISVESCLVSCQLMPYTGPSLQRRQFGKVMQADGTLCGPVSVFHRSVLGITTRCLRGQCVEFGCDGVSVMENRKGVKVKDMCGVCGGDNSTCNAGHSTMAVAEGQRVTLVTLPTGTRNILFAVKPDSAQSASVKLALTTKDNSFVIVPGSYGRFKITNNENNPLTFAGTHWTTVDNEVLSAPGPLDQPVKIKVAIDGSGSANAVIVWGYKRPGKVPPAPKCQNNGTAIASIGGCLCGQPNTHGKACEYRCRFDFCYNGGEKMPKNCRCNCTDTVRTNPNSRCACRPGFAGPDCSQCAVRKCYHGGVHNVTSCQCLCPAGCDGKPDCSDCKFNPLLKGYEGHYGLRSLQETVAALTGGASGPSTAQGHAGCVSVMLVATWFLNKLLGVHLL